MGPQNLNFLRVDQVGSLLRPEALKKAFSDFGNRRITEKAFEKAQETAIRDVVKAQKRIGFPVVTDGEFRRINFQTSFAHIDGWDLWTGAWKGYLENPMAIMPGEKSHTMGRDTVQSHRVPATAKLALRNNLPLSEYLSIAELTDIPVKALLMGPDRVAQMCDIADSPDYVDRAEFLDDVVHIQRQMIGELVDAGCPYIQLDEPSYTGYVDMKTLKLMEDRGEDPTTNLLNAIEASNGAIEGLRGKTCFGLHICRGNRASMWHREGSYEGIAEILFSSLKFDRLLLEYDTDRAGGFEALRFIPDNVVAVLGLVTTKTGEMETADELLRRIEEASQFIDVDQIAISPQCGFASAMGGNFINEEEQWAKLELLMETSRRVWDA